MFEKFADSARMALFHARMEVSRRSHPEIRPEHLILGLLQDERMRALLDDGDGFALGPDGAESLRGAAEGRLQGLGADASVGDEIPLADPAKRALHLSLRESAALGSSEVTAPMMLLGLFRAEEDAGAGGPLHDVGLDLALARRFVATLPPESPPRSG